MDTHIMGTGLTITSELRGYVDRQKKKVEKFVHDPATRLDIEFERLTERNTGNEFRAEFMVRGGGLDVRSESSAGTLHGAIDEAVEQLLIELRKVKGKKQRLFKLGGLKLKNWMRFGAGYERLNNNPPPGAPRWRVDELLTHSSVRS